MVRNSKRRQAWAQGRWIFCLIASLIIGLGILQAMGYMAKAVARVACKPFVIDSVSVQFTDFYSAALKQQILSQIHQKSANANFLFFNKTDFYSSLRNQFSTIEKIAITSLFPRGMQVHVIGTRPKYLINDQYVLAQNKKLYDKSYFSLWGNEEHSALAVALSEVNDRALEQLYTAFSTVPNSLFSKYAVMYTNPSCIELRSLEEGDCRLVVVNSATLADEQLFAKIPDVIGDMYHRGILVPNKRKNKKQNLLVDLRFDKRIIVKVIGENKRGRWG